MDDIKPIKNTCTQEATSLTDLNKHTWRVVGSRPTTATSDWDYAPGIIPRLAYFFKHRTRGGIIVTQRRDRDKFTLLAKVARDYHAAVA